jgi:hypothetical protein
MEETRVTREMKEVTEKLFSDQVVSSTPCHKWELNSHKHLNIFFKPHSILITIISCDNLNLSLADEHVGDVTIPTQVIEYITKNDPGESANQFQNLLFPIWNSRPT